MLFTIGPVYDDMGVEISGLDGLEDALNEMLGDALELGETNEIPFTELFPPDFMRLYTEFDDISEFFDNSPWDVEYQEDFQDIPNRPFDEYINEFTDFPDWKIMKQKAGERYLKRKLG